MRSFYLGDKKVANSGVQVTEEILKRYKVELVSDLKILFPRLKNLHVGYIKTSHVSRPEGLYITASLHELNQFSFQFSGHRSKSINALYDDRYQQFCQLLTEDAKKLKTEIVLATNQFRLAEQLLSGGNINVRDKELRKLIKRAGSDLSLFEDKFSLIESESRISNALPISMPLKISCCVESICSRFATIRGVKDLCESCGQHRFNFAKKLKLLRPMGIKYSEHGLKLFNSMEIRSLIILEVNVCFNKITGDIEYLDLVNIMK